MPKLKVGETLLDFVYYTPFSKEISFSKKVALKEKTAIIFLRYYGCPVCQYDIHQISVNHKSIVGDSGQIFVVLQSEAEKLAQQIGMDSLPFEIICDPYQTLYKQFDIMVANSEEELMTEEEYSQIENELAAYEHGEYEGNELQLPAVFIIDKNMKVLFTHYGTSLVDIPNVKELEELMK